MNKIRMIHVAVASFFRIRSTMALRHQQLCRTHITCTIRSHSSTLLITALIRLGMRVPVTRRPPPPNHAPKSLSLANEVSFPIVHVCVLYLELMILYKNAASSENQSDQDTQPLPAQRARIVENMYNALTSNVPQETPEPITPKDFRKAVYEAGVKVVSVQLSHR